jgi:XTP/dITP diphosphohydrolase
MRQTRKIVLATQNWDKYEEFKVLFAAHPEVELVPASEFLRNPERLSAIELHDDYLGNAMAKARLANQGCHYPCLADDSGLECAALEGRPGVHSHRFAPPRAGVPQYEANNRLLLELLSGKPRDARFVCTLALALEGIVLHARGELEGTIIEAPRGSNGFGFDPLFVPKGSGKTFAEMTQPEKNQISHRARAVQALMGVLKEHGIRLARV